MSSALFTSIHSEAGRGGILAACLAVVLCVGPSYGQAAAEYYAVSTADLPIHGNFAQTDNLPG